MFTLNELLVKSNLKRVGCFAMHSPERAVFPLESSRGGKGIPSLVVSGRGHRVLALLVLETSDEVSASGRLPLLRAAGLCAVKY